MIILSAISGWSTWQLDFVMGYSQADISTNHVYIEMSKGFEFGGSRDTHCVHVLKSLDGKNDVYEDACNLEDNSGVPSLCNTAYMSMATELITSFLTKVAHILVQSRLHNDKWQPFCNHLLVTSFTKDSHLKITCVESRNHQQEVMMKRDTWSFCQSVAGYLLFISSQTKDTQEGSKMHHFQAWFGVGMAEIAFHSALLMATTWIFILHCSGCCPSFQQKCSKQTAARELIYADQQNDLESYAKFEEELLCPNSLFLMTPTTANQQLNVVCWPQPSIKIKADIGHCDRVIRMDTILSDSTANHLLEYILEQQHWAAAKTNNTNADTASTTTAWLFYLVEQAHTTWCDLLLSLLHQGYAWDDDPTVHADQRNGLHILADALQELLGAQRTLCGMYEE
jgi:hypothetical protein